MKEITAIKEARSRKERVNIFLDGKFAFSLESEVAAKEGLQTGEKLSSGQIEALTRASSRQRCLAAALNFLTYRPRSESEMRERLRQRGFDGEIIEAVMTGLKERGLVDDASFARFWGESRDSFKPRSQWLIKQELKQKGVAREIIDQVAGGIDDNDMAYRAALNKRHTLVNAEYETFRRRLGGYLKRRGFSYEVINRTVVRLWQELAEGKKN